MSSRHPRIAIAGIAIESSTFSPHRAGERDFRIWEGSELVERYSVLSERGSHRARAEWVPIVYARSIPGGAVERDVYEQLKWRILTGLAEQMDQGLDGLFLDIHGAMSVVGLDDAEGDLMRSIRDVIGAAPFVSAAMDLHGNVSRQLIENLDIITCYRLAPHEDAFETKNRAIVNLVEALESGTRPVRAWVNVPILLPGEKTSTRVEPAKSLYRRLEGVEAQEGVIDAAIWVGYAWADEPRCHATVVVSGTDRARISEEASALATEFWRVREQFEFVGPPGTLDEGIDAALHAVEKPYVISDSGDNPGAGGTGDVTWTLTRLLQRPELTAADGFTTLCGSIFDAEAIESLAGAAIGDEVTVTAGARVDSGPSGPVTFTGRLVSFTHGDPDAGRIAVIAVGGLHAVITEFRKAYHSVSAFRELGLDPASADLIVTKIGYLEPELYDIARGWTLALTPGGVDQALDRLGHHRITRPMFPFDTFATDPDLSAELVG